MGKAIRLAYGEAVAKLGIPRLRFTTSHPWDFSSKMIEIIAKYDNIMKFIHLPVQSGVPAQTGIPAARL